MFHVHPYLVRAAGFETALYQAYIIQSFQNGIMSNSMFSFIAIGVNFHLHTFAGIAADVAGYGAFVLLQVAPNQCNIFTFDGAVEKLFGKVRKCVFGFAKDNESAGAFIQTVYQAGAKLFLSFRQTFKVPENRIDEGSTWITEAGMHNDLGRFVDDNDVVIFIHHINRNVFGNQVVVLGVFGHDEQDIIIGPDLITGFNGFAVHLYASCIGSALNFSAADIVAQVAMQKFINTDRGLPLVNFQIY